MENKYKIKKNINFSFILNDFKKIFFKDDSPKLNFLDEEYIHNIKNFSLNERWEYEFDQIFPQISQRKFNRGLDIGCNAGYGTKILQKKLNCKFNGVDISSKAIEHANANNRSQLLKFDLFDGLKLPFESNTFDIITILHVIGHVKNMNVFIEEVRRTLKPNGKLIVITPNGLYKFFAIIDSIKNSYKPDLTVRRYYFKNQLIKIFISKKFKKLTCKYIGIQPLLLNYFNIQITKSRIACVFTK